MSGFKRGTRYAILICSLAVGGGTEAAGDAARGAKVFQACMACHSVERGEHMTGPSLANVWQRKAGTVEGFARYSDAMKRAGIRWTGATLDKWLSNPEGLLPGTNMTFPGLKESKDRDDVIAYLEAVSENKAPQAKQGGRGMMMRGAKLELRKAPPEGQVTAIKYCGDTYTVETADGKTQKIWEFNLRFKTDSSKNGPIPGKPVIVGAGMRGDRASVVFAVPAEIGSFIKQTCQ